MFEFNFQIAPDILPTWIDNIENQTVLLAEVIEESGGIMDDMETELDAVNVYPGPVAYPIEWTSEKQRRFVFGFVLKRDAQGNIIPYERKGTMFDEAKVEFDASLLTLRITDPNPIRRYVVDTDQQKFHKNTGWFQSDEPYMEITISAQQRIIDSWFRIIDFPGAP